jgi:hypothetical protein
MGGWVSRGCAPSGIDGTGGGAGRTMSDVIKMPSTLLSDGTRGPVLGARRTVSLPITPRSVWGLWRGVSVAVV